MEKPRLKSAFDFLAGWFSTKRSRPYVDMRELSNGTTGVSPLQVAEALEVLVGKKLLTVSYRVIAPTTRTLTDDYFQSLDDIPEYLNDSRDDLFETSNAQVIQVYRGAA